MNLSAALDLYMNICLQALGNATHKVGATHVPIGNRLKQLVANILLLHMVLPRKINFTQMERYGIHTEKTYREAHRVEIDWVGINISLMQMVFKAGERLAHASRACNTENSCAPRGYGLIGSTCMVKGVNPSEP